MARIALNSNATEPSGLPNTGDGVEMGDKWNTVIANLNTMLTELFGGTSTIAGAKTYTGAAAFQGAVTVVPGGAAATNTGKPVLDLSTNVTAFSSGNTNASQTMFTYSVPKSTLASAGQGLFIETWGSVAGNAAPKSIALNVGGKTLSTGSFTSSGSSWSMDAYVFKTAANAQTLLLEAWQGTTRVLPVATTDTSVDTDTITITVVASDASAGSADILGNGLLVQFLP